MTVIYQVDSFTEIPFRGNPAAVCLLDSERDASWMQQVAAEMNLSETAFLVPLGEQKFRLRWFTPTTEVDLCGHATLAAAHILHRSYQLPGPVSFETLSGTLIADFFEDWIRLDFPRTDPVPQPVPEVVLQALQVEPVYSGRTIHDYLIEVADESIVQNCQPDFNLLRETGVRGVMITAKVNDQPHDFVSRFFVPGAGIDEDPVTGSAHCALFPYWSSILKRDRLTGFQASKRGGTVVGEVFEKRVFLYGKAITILKCQFLC
jgi:predicted PhzF superfamily epimerase YddE/YHI9